jgi:RNA polymerase sigma-70 factor (ECF subfamily)
LSSSNSTPRTLPIPLLWPSEERTIPADPSEIRSANDEQLFTGLKANNREALGELFRRYSRLVFSIGLRILRNVTEAEEVVQEVFLFVYQRAALFDERKGGAKAWLVQVAYHRSLDRQEYLQRRNFYSGTDFDLLADTLRGKEDVEGEFEAQNIRERLKNAFEKLSDRQRLTLELFFFEDLDFREIAARLDETRDNVRHHYYRGLQKLRKDTFLNSSQARTNHD